LPSLLAAGGIRRLTRLMVPENVNSGRSPDLKTPRRNHRAPGAHDFAGSLDQFALACGIEEFAGE
jgi:hypothetical protein